MSETTPISDGGPAFSCDAIDVELRTALVERRNQGESLSFQLINNLVKHHPGMSLRAWFCGYAPAIPIWYRSDLDDPERTARWRAHYADAQIAILEGRPIPQLQSPQ